MLEILDGGNTHGVHPFSMLASRHARTPILPDPAAATTKPPPPTGIQIDWNEGIVKPIKKSGMARGLRGQRRPVPPSR